MSTITKNKFTFNIESREQLLEKWLTVFNCLLELSGGVRLTDREKEVLVQLIIAHEDLKEKWPMLFNSFMRRKIQNLLSMSDFNLNNQIKSLIKKGIIIKVNNRELKLNVAVFPDMEMNSSKGISSITTIEIADR